MEERKETAIGQDYPSGLVIRKMVIEIRDSKHVVNSSGWVTLIIPIRE